jgi:SAM-dependent methyltransferase
MTFFWICLAVFLVFGLVVFRGSPYVPSQKKYIRQAFTDLYKITSKDVLIDIGSGDGVVLREASKLGARSIGYEINPLLVFISRFLSFKNKKITVHLADFWSAKIPDDTTIIYVFSVTRDIKNITRRLRKEVNRIGHSVYLLSFAGDFTDLKLVKKNQSYRLYLINKI